MAPPLSCNDDVGRTLTHLKERLTYIAKRQSTSVEKDIVSGDPIFLLLLQPGALGLHPVLLRPLSLWRRQEFQLRRGEAPGESGPSRVHQVCCSLLLYIKGGPKLTRYPTVQTKEDPSEKEKSVFVIFDQNFEFNRVLSPTPTPPAKVQHHFLLHRPPGDFGDCLDSCWKTCCSVDVCLEDDI